MRDRSVRSRFLVLLLLVVAGGAAFSGHGHGQTMPPGHPPAGGPSRPAAPALGSGTGAQALTWTAPAGWTAETPSSPMRRAQYRIQGPAGPAECAVFYFGPGQGGDARANAARWGSQFQGPDGKSAAAAVKTREIKVGTMPVLLVEVSGTYVGGMAGAPTGPARPDHMLLGAIAQGPDANWFFRATGPRGTLERERAAFEAMIRSIKRGEGA